MRKYGLPAMLLALLMLLASGCQPEVGSEAWCKQLKEKPTGEWSLNEAQEYAKSCVFK